MDKFDYKGYLEEAIDRDTDRIDRFIRLLVSADKGDMTIAKLKAESAQIVKERNMEVEYFNKVKKEHKNRVN